MADAQARGWGDPGTPGTASAEAYRKAHVVTIDVGGVRLSVRREVAPLFAGFISEIVKGGYDLTARADDWGYVCRYIRGYETQQILSNHSWGLAIDLNAIDHPLGQRNTGVPRFVVEAAYDHGLFWGGDYVNRPDEMHFEYLGTPQDAAELIASMHPATSGDDMLPDEREAVLTANHFVKNMWPDFLERYKQDMADLLMMIGVVKDGAPAYGIESTPVAVTAIRKKLGA